MRTMWLSNLHSRNSSHMAQGDELSAPRACQVRTACRREATRLLRLVMLVLATNVGAAFGRGELQVGAPRDIIAVYE